MYNSVNGKLFTIDRVVHITLIFIPFGFLHVEQMDKSGRPQAAAFYTGQVGFHDLLFVSTSLSWYSI